MRGDGSIYKRGRRWWVAYYRDGKLYREPGGDSKREAREKLRETHRRVIDGSFLTPSERRITVNDLRLAVFYSEDCMRAYLDA